jgi:uncharacterized phage-associated protein
MLSALAVANHFIHRAQQQELRLSGVQLQSLVYLAHGMRLGLFSEPLIDEPFFAGPQGVFAASLNLAGAAGERELHRHLSEIVRNAHGLLDECIPVLADDEPAKATLDQTWARFHESSVEALDRLIRKTGGPWHDTWHSPERLMGKFTATLTHTWDAPTSGERPVAIANSGMRNWFRSALIKDTKRRDVEAGLEPTTRIDRKQAEKMLTAAMQWDPSMSIPLA